MIFFFYFFSYIATSVYDTIYRPSGDTSNMGNIFNGHLLHKGYKYMKSKQFQEIYRTNFIVSAHILHF